MTCIISAYIRYKFLDIDRNILIKVRDNKISWAAANHAGFRLFAVLLWKASNAGNGHAAEHRCYLGKPQTLGTGMLQNADVLFVMTKMIEGLGLDNANSFFQTLSPIPTSASVGDSPTRLALWTMRSAPGAVMVCQSDTHRRSCGLGPGRWTQ